MEVNDKEIAIHLAGVIRNFEQLALTVPKDGIEFEQTIFERTLEQFAWSQVCGPDQFNLGLPITSQTGTIYEFDSAFFDKQQLYVVEAKRLRGNLSREHISLFVMKLMDLFLGAYEEIGHLEIHPVIVSSSARVDQSAYLYAISWGILIISSKMPTPFEVAAALSKRQIIDAFTEAQIADHIQLGNECWRPLNTIFAIDPTQKSKVNIDKRRIFGRQRSLMLWEQWMAALAHHTGLE